MAIVTLGSAQYKSVSLSSETIASACLLPSAVGLVPQGRDRHGQNHKAKCVMNFALLVVHEQKLVTASVSQSLVNF